MEKNMITEKQGEGQFDIDAELDHLRKKLESACLGGNVDEISRLERQVSLLEDSVIVYRLTSAPERRMFTVDLEDLPQTNAANQPSRGG